VVIACIFFDGQVFRTESDEYVEIVNRGDAAQDMSGWRLVDTDGAPQLLFPSLVLAPRGRVRVYTDEVHHEWGGLSFGSARAVWNNSDPDTAELYNRSGELVSAKSYPPGGE
jgi:hypothetical protein